MMSRAVFELPGLGINLLLTLLSLLCGYKCLASEGQVSGSSKAKALDSLVIILLLQESQTLKLPLFWVTLSVAKGSNCVGLRSRSSCLPSLLFLLQEIFSSDLLHSVKLQPNSFERLASFSIFVIDEQSKLWPRYCDIKELQLSAEELIATLNIAWFVICEPNQGVIEFFDELCVLRILVSFKLLNSLVILDLNKLSSFGFSYLLN